MQPENSIKPRVRNAWREVLVFDYDGTLTHALGEIPDGTQRVLKRIGAEGLAVLGIVSGRELPYLKQVNYLMAGAFSFLVAENGAVVFFSDQDEVLLKGRDWSDRARLAFSKVDFPFRFAEIIGATRREYSDRITQLLKESSVEAKLVPNRDSVMVLPPDVDKGTGVAEAVAHYGETKDIHLTCFGDGENDVALFGPADTRVAVGDSVEQLKRVADVVTKKPGGYGVQEYLETTFLKTVRYTVAGSPEGSSWL